MDDAEEWIFFFAKRVVEIFCEPSTALRDSIRRQRWPKHKITAAPLKRRHRKREAALDADFATWKGQRSVDVNCLNSTDLACMKFGEVVATPCLRSIGSNDGLNVELPTGVTRLDER